MAEPTYNLVELSNGLRLLHIPSDTAAVYVSMMGTVGRRAELDSEIGAAHFLEHLFFDGTTKRLSAIDIAMFTERLGAIKNGTTGQELVNYWIKILAKEAEAAFDFVSDIFLNSRLEEIEKERSVIAQEAANRRDDPDDTLYRLMIATLYPNQTVGRTIFDEDINLPNINLEVLKAYQKRNYVAQNFVLCVAGNINFSKAKKLAEKYFADVPSGSKVTFAPAKINPSASIEIASKDFVQSKLALSFAGPKLNDVDSPATKLMVGILGKGMSSRLVHRLRNELHLVYATFAADSAMSDTGYVNVWAYVDEPKLQQTITEVISQINLLIARGVTSDELDKIKTMALSGLLFASENIINVGHSYTVQLLLSGHILTDADYVRAINAVTTADIQTAAGQIFSDQPKLNVLTKTLTDLKVGEIKV